IKYNCIKLFQSFVKFKYSVLHNTFLRIYICIRNYYMPFKMIDKNQKNIATFIHLSTFSRFLFPLGNFIGPIVLWVANKDKSDFIDAHGKQAINFQISILLYAIILGMITIPL